MDLGKDFPKNTGLTIFDIGHSIHTSILQARLVLLEEA